jgi:heme-degrading monooxygenase HmoA
MHQSSVFPLTLMEAGFKIIPGMETEFFEVQNRMVPIGMSQPGFVAVYGGLIADSQWLYFSVRFATPEEMSAWHEKPGHRAVQRTAYEKWWTAMYIRKWQRPRAEVFNGDRFFCETRFERDSPMSDVDLRSLKAELEGLPKFGVKRFETHSGHYDLQPYQLAGPLEIAPASATVSYALLTHWASHADLSRWQDSPAYRAIRDLGAVTTEVFVPLPEVGERDNLRRDRLQRDWAAAPS